MGGWIPGKKLPITFAERFGRFNSGKRERAFPFIATFTNNWEASSPYAPSWMPGMSECLKRAANL
jgi:hypothetical protein